MTSYMELVLGAQAADVAHPAFSKMFVRTEFLPRQGVLLANRRRRAPDEPELWCFASRGRRRRDHGRTGVRNRPHAIHRPRPGIACAARHAGRPEASGLGGHGTGCGVRVALLRVCAGRWHGAHRVLDLRGAGPVAGAGTGGQTSRYHRAHARGDAGVDAGTGAAAASRHRRVAGQSVPATRRTDPVRRRAARSSPDAIRRGAAGPQPLWSQGISGDLPIVLIRIEETDDLPVVRQLLQAHEYWGIKRLSVDLVVLNERAASYVQDLQIALESMVRVSQAPAPYCRRRHARQGVRAAR